jgi:hypothetical protein
VSSRTLTAAEVLRAGSEAVPAHTLVHAADHEALEVDHAASAKIEAGADPRNHRKAQPDAAVAHPVAAVAQSDATVAQLVAAVAQPYVAHQTGKLILAAHHVQCPSRRITDRETFFSICLKTILSVLDCSNCYDFISC